MAVLNSGYSKDEQLMHLVRCLFFVLAAWDILPYACHIPRVRNSVADAISRDKISFFFSKVPDASPHPRTVPQNLVDLLVTVQPDWTLHEGRSPEVTSNGGSMCSAECMLCPNMADRKKNTTP